MNGEAALFERDGALPDSLRGLRTGMDWNGRPGVATVVQLMPSHCLQTVLHESFHTYQHMRRSSSRFQVSTDTRIEPPIDDPEAGALLMLEGRFLVDALMARDSAARLTAAQRAAVARDRRCARVHDIECRRERDAELLEGSAEYAAAALASRGDHGDRLRAVRDSARAHLLAVGDLRLLDRPYFYWTGAAWIALAAAVGDSGWSDEIERGGIGAAVARVLGPRIRDSATVARSRAFAAALDSVRAIAIALTNRERERLASASKAFWSQEGIAVRFRWSPVNGLSSYGRQSPHGDQEFGLRWHAPGNELTARGLMLRSCCPQTLVIIVPRDDLDIVVSGRHVPLDASGRKESGPLTVRGKGIDAQAGAGEVVVWADSIAIQLGVRPGR